MMSREPAQITVIGTCTSGGAYCRHRFSVIFLISVYSAKDLQGHKKGGI